MNLRRLQQTSAIEPPETMYTIKRNDCSPKTDKKLFRIRCGLSVFCDPEHLSQFGLHDKSKLTSWFDVDSNTELSLIYMSENDHLEFSNGNTAHCYLFLDILVNRYFMCYKGHLLAHRPEYFDKNNKLILSS